MKELFEIAGQLLNSYHVLFLITSFSLISKLAIFIFLSYRCYKTKKTPHPLYYVFWVLTSSWLLDFAWFVKLLDILQLSQHDYRITLFIIRIAWAFNPLGSVALSLLIESLLVKTFYLNRRQKILFFFSVLFFLFFAGLAFFDTNCASPIDRPYYEIEIQFIEMLFNLFPTVFLSVCVTLIKLKYQTIPRILKKQIQILIFTLILPYWLTDAIQNFPINLTLNRISNYPAFASIATIIITYAIFYSARKMMGMRFLNFQKHVQSPAKFTFIDEFKTILEQLSQVTNIEELSHITQVFFKETFSIPINKTHMVIRDNKQKESTQKFDNYHNVESLVDTFLTTHNDIVCTYLITHKIVIYDELAFSNFYERNDAEQALLSFMNTVHADIFIPVYEAQKMIAYIIIDRYARIHEFYSNIDRDEMLVFASYLGNIINLLHNKNLESLIHHKKKLHDILFVKHQEINQYKESIRSFLSMKPQHETGIIFFKNRRFTYANQAAKEMINLDINTHEGHPLAKALKHIALQVEEYQSAQIHYAKDHTGQTIILSAVPNLEHKHVIITCSYPDISDVIKRQSNLLRDPSDRDYLLYLETTKSGKLINQYIPGSSEQFLNYKIDLLKISLSKKAVFLDLPENDLIATTELLHHINLGEQLHILHLNSSTPLQDIGIKLFGIHPIFSRNASSEPLLKKLDPSGTLLIKNIEFLPLEVQDSLAEFLQYGMFKMYKSDQRISSNVRILCSSHRSLAHLVQQGVCSKLLFNELKNSILSMPSLITLSDEEFNITAQGFIEQAVQDQTFKHFFVFTEKDSKYLLNNRPESLHDLKIKIQNTLLNKSKETQKSFKKEFLNTTFEVTNPDLAQAARLGKNALKDYKVMALLWRTFKNQNKIALFLGVNRSSVNRRCKEFHLT